MLSLTCDGEVASVLVAIDSSIFVQSAPTFYGSKFSLGQLVSVILFNAHLISRAHCTKPAKTLSIRISNKR